MNGRATWIPASTCHRRNACYRPSPSPFVLTYNLMTVDRFLTLGKRYFHSTCVPRHTSTAGFVSMSNHVQDSPVREGVRRQVKAGHPGLWVVGNEEEIDGTDVESPTQPTATNTKERRHTYANALRAARAELQRTQRVLATFQIALAEGRADLFPEVPVVVQGFKLEIDADAWLITRVTHRVDGSGFAPLLDLELHSA